MQRSQIKRRSRFTVKLSFRTFVHVVVVDISMLNVSRKVGGGFVAAGETHALRNWSLLRVAQFELAKVGFLQ
jgi:hypothetical protein